MLCPCRASTPRAPHQKPKERPQQRRAGGGVLVLLDSCTTSSSVVLPPQPLRAQRRRSRPEVAASAAPPAQDATSARGDGLITSAAAGTAASPAPAAAPSSPTPPQTPPLIAAPPDLLIEFEHKLQGDLKAVGVTIVAVTGVIVYWRGVWSLLDHVLGDSVFGDVACVAIGLLTVLGIRLSGAKMSSFWPTS